MRGQLQEQHISRGHDDDMYEEYESQLNHRYLYGTARHGARYDGRYSSGGRGVGALILRALGGVGVLVLFGACVSMGYSRQTQSAGPGGGGTTLQENSGSPYVQTSATPALMVRATNEYGEYDRAALNMYGFEMVVEPFRETVLTAVDRTSAQSSRPATYNWRIMQADLKGKVDHSVPAAAKGVGPSEFTVTLTRPGSLYILDVEKQDEDGTVVASSRVTITCKYVRRELRDLTRADRDAFFDALQEFYTVPMKAGRAKYGPDFSNYVITTALHNADRSQFCYHAGIQFLSAHTSFNLIVERSLQMINPKVSLASWDFMIDAYNFGTDWHKSPIFGDEMFGSAVNSAEDHFQVSNGRFRNVSSIHDPDHTLGHGWNQNEVAVMHNPFGYIDAVSNYQDLPRLTRTSSYCGLKSEASFATADVLVGCFENNDNVKDWEACLEKKVHGDMHGLLGGAFNCNVNFKAFHEANAAIYSAGLLTFVLDFMTTHFWPDNSFMPDNNTCDTVCEKGDADCGCTCNIDAMSISATQVYDLSENFLEMASNRFAGGTYVSYDENARFPWGFQQDGNRLKEDDTIFLLRHLVKLGCEPGTVGYMSGGASPMDPIFWVLHPMFEKALHILWYAPQYRNKYSFEWDGSDCNGSKLGDAIPSTEKWLGFGEGNDFLTNADIMEILHPSNPGMPYIYDKFGQWGGRKDWDPCPECSAAAAD